MTSRLMASQGTAIDLDKLRAVKSSIDQLQNMFDCAGDASLDGMAQRCTIDWGSWSDPGSRWVAERVGVVSGHVRSEVAKLKAELVQVATLLQATIDQHQAAEDANASVGVTARGTGAAGAGWTGL